MVKTIALIKRKADISREEFVRHYEEVHAPLALKHLPMIKRYLRNHVSSVVVEGELQFDCISEFRFDSLEDAVGVVEFVESEAGQIFRDDEMTFMERESTQSFLVEERTSDIPRPAQQSTQVKAVALLAKKPDLSRDAFIEYYEGRHAPLILEHAVGLVRYARNYVVPMGEDALPFDSFTELWFDSHEAYEKTLAERVSEAGAVIADDEAKFLDTARMAFFVVKECVSL